MRRRRLRLERSGPWICWAGMAALLWTYLASFAYAPWWGGVLFVLVYLGLVFVALERTVGSAVDPLRAAVVPVWGLLIAVSLTGAGVIVFGW